MRRNKLEICLHLVWATWDRLPLITKDIQRDLYRYLEGICGKDHCEVLAVGGVTDHVHLLVLFPATLTVADLLGHLKGSSSRFVSDTLLPGEWFAWQGNYGVFSVSRRDRRKVICYIENQAQHHAEGTHWPEAEETCETL